MQFKKNAHQDKGKPEGMMTYFLTGTLAYSLFY